MKRVVVMILALALAVSATCVLAQQPPAGPGPAVGGAARPGFAGGGFGNSPSMVLAPPNPMMLSRIQGLQLNEDQMAKLTAILNKGQTTLQPLRQKVMEAATPLRAALADPQFDAQKVAGLAAASAKAEAAVTEAEIGIWKEVRTVLTGAQVKMIQDSMGAGMRQPRQPRQPGVDAPPDGTNRQPRTRRNQDAPPPPQY